MENKNDSTIRTLKQQIKTLEDLNNEKPEVILKQLSDIYDYLTLLKPNPSQKEINSLSSDIR